MGFKYPVSLNLTGKSCTVIGGGKIAYRKVQGLLAAGAMVQVVSPQAYPPLEELTDPKLTLIKDIYREEYLGHSFLVVAATNDRQTNQQIASYCHRHNILVNVIDSKEDSSFIVNKALQQGDLMIAVSTNGHSPILAQRIIKDLESRYGQEYRLLVELLGEAREMAKNHLREDKRKAFLAAIIDEELLGLISNGEMTEARERVNKCLLSYWE